MPAQVSLLFSRTRGPLSLAVRAVTWSAWSHVALIGKATSTAAAPFTGDELPAYKIPLVGRLYGNTKGASSESQKFYENVTRANEAENEIKGRLKAGLSVADYLRENPAAMAMAAQGNAAERQASLLRKMRSGLVEQGGADKVARVREVNERIAAVMRGFNRQVDQLEAR